MRYALTESDWQLALARYQEMPETIRIAILGQSLGKQEILGNIQARTETGEKLVAMQANYLKWLQSR